MSPAMLLEHVLKEARADTPSGVLIVLLDSRGGASTLHCGFTSALLALAGATISMQAVHYSAPTLEAPPTKL
jgi:hypothetical protein